MARGTGLEPVTDGLENRCSIRLSYPRGALITNWSQANFRRLKTELSPCFVAVGLRADENSDEAGANRVSERRTESVPIGINGRLLCVAQKGRQTISPFPQDQGPQVAPSGGCASYATRSRPGGRRRGATFEELLRRWLELVRPSMKPNAWLRKESPNSLVLLVRRRVRHP